MKKKKPKKLEIVYENIYDSLSPEEKARADWNIEQAFDMIFTKAIENISKQKLDKKR